LLGDLRQVFRKQRDRLVLVGGIVEPVERGGEGADVSDHGVPVRVGPALARAADQPLVAPDHVGGVGELVEAARLGLHLERREQQGAGVLLFHERLVALQDAAGGDRRVVAILEQVLPLQDLEEHECVTGGERVHGERLAAQIVEGLHLRHGDETQEPVVAAHEREQVVARFRNLALALPISDQVVDRRHGDVELPVDQVGELEDRVRRRRGLHLDPVLREQALLLRDPDGPVEAAGEDDDVDRGGGLGGRRGRRRARARSEGDGKNDHEAAHDGPPFVTPRRYCSV